jgi:hypothetical protein
MRCEVQQHDPFFALPAPGQQNAGRLSFGGSFDAPVH